MSEFENTNTCDENLEDIAVIGMAGRFPKAKNLDEFWQNLRDGKECISFFSPEELQESGVDPAVSRSPNFVNARAILEDADHFDAAFFGISPREAELTDPQHRIFLECAWEATEQAGYDPEKYEGLIGVYAGADINSYALKNLLFQSTGLETLIGNDKDYLATRLSFKLNLKGPGISVQTACSTSLVAIQLACQGLISYQCDMALAGGVGIAFPQKAGYWYHEGGILSPDGHCRAFDTNARGTVGGDGAGIVLLKRYQEALEDGDCIHAVIRGSALNNDGSFKLGFTAPSVEGQAEVIAMAQAAAGIDPETISYVEAHGTGTELGDPIEVSALTDVFRASTDKKNFCAIGSLKSNVGHMNCAAGVGSLIKTILALKHRMIPPSLNFETPNPRISFSDSPFYVNTQLTPWDTGDQPRRAGVSSFGVGGTNAHVIVEEAPVTEASGPSRNWQLLMLSARTVSAMDTATANLTEHLRKHPNLSLPDAAYTLHVGRQLFRHRRMLVCQNLEDAITTLENQDPKRVFSTVREPGNTTVAFMFPGQGAQYVNMGRELYERESVFQEEIDHCAELLKPRLGLDLRNLFYPPDDQAEDAAAQLKQTSVTQPALFVIEYALAKLWISWDIQPEAMIGHSVGEYVCACLAGVFSLEDALMLVAARGQLIGKMPRGDMLSVPLSEADALGYPLVSVAAVNAPERCVLSGTSDAIQEVTRQLNEKDIASQQIHTSHAFHSEMTEPILDEFRALLNTVSLNPPQMPYVSNVTGTWVSEADATDPNYWTRHIRQTVRFSAGISELMKEPDRVLLEVGPGRTLMTLTQKHAQANQRIVLTSLRHPREKESDIAFLLNTLGRLCLAGVKADWAGFYADEQRHRIPLPTYPFERERYWADHEHIFKDITAQAWTLKNPNIGEWLYLPSWKRSLPGSSELGETDVPQCWLVFSDDASPLCSELLRRLKAEIPCLITVTPGTDFHKIDEEQYHVDPESSEDYERLLETLAEEGKLPEKIVHLWQIASPSDFERTQYLGIYSLLFLVKAIEKQHPENPMQISVLTRGLSEVTGDEPIRPEKAPVLGACKVIPQEFSSVTCCHIDIRPSEDGSSDRRLADQIFKELTAKATDPVVAYRGPHRWTETFEPIRISEIPDEKLPLRENGVYLITGGLGNIGLTFAAYLAGKVRARLVLVGRTGLPPREEWDTWIGSHDVQDKVRQRIHKVRELESLGAEVLVLSADVADEKQMGEVIHLAQEQFGNIHGVIHGAGIVGEELFRAIQDTHPHHCALHFRPKAQGLYVLEKILPQTSDFCVLLSSLATTLGGVGFMAYAAANHFMDAFALWQNRKNGVPWISINWDGWQLSDEAPEDLSSLETLAILPAEGIAVFERILSLNVPGRIVVSTGDLQARMAQWLRSDPRKASDLADGAESVSYHARPELDNEYVEPRNEMEEIIARLWQELLKIEQIGIYDNFFKLGGDSLIAIQLSTRLREELGVDLTVHNLFDEPVIASLAKRIQELQEFGSTSVDEISQKLEMIENLSDEEVQKLLAELEERDS